MIKFLGLVFVTFVILEINGLVNSYSIKPVNDKVRKSGFFHIVDDLLDKNGKHSKDLMKDKEVLICKNCTIVIAAASNGSTAGNRLSVGNNNAASAVLDEPVSNGRPSNGVDSYEIPFPPLNNGGTNGAGAAYNGVGASDSAYNDVGASVPSNYDVGASAPAYNDVGASVPSNYDLGASVPAYNDVGASVPSYYDVGASVPAYNEVDASDRAYNGIGASVPVPSKLSVNGAVLNGVNTESLSNDAADTNNGAGDSYRASAYGQESYIAAAPANHIDTYEVNGDNYASVDD